MAEISVLQFSTIVDCLHTVSRILNHQGKPWSSSEWARQLGYRSPQSVSMVLSGERPPSKGLVTRISQLLGLDTKQARYLDLIASAERMNRHPEKLGPIVAEIRKLNPNYRNKLSLSYEQFQFIADWQFTVLRQLMKIADCSRDPQQISSILKNALKPDEVASSLKILLNLGFLQRSQDRISPTQDFCTPDDIPAEAGRQHLRQMMQRALVSLQDDELDVREFGATTMVFRREDLPAAKQMIRQFQYQFEKQFGSQKGDHVYQLNLQFFPHTRNPTAKSET